MTRLGFLLLAPLWLSGCYGYPPQRENAAQYRPGVTEQLYALAFVPGHVDPAPQDRAVLAVLRPAALRAGVSAVLVTDSPLAVARAASVSRVLGRSVTVDAQAGTQLGRDQALLVLFQHAVVADACTGAGQPVGRNLWTLDDNSRQRMLPAGCATATMLLEQTANRQDVLRGQLLEPGAAGPMARAADRYLRRNDEPPPRGEDQPGAGETSEERPNAAQTAAPAAALGVQPLPSQVAPQERRLPPASIPQ